MAMFNPQTNNLRCFSASVDRLATASETALGVPVVNETGLSGKLTAAFKLVPNDLAAANNVLGKQYGLTLVSAKRPIETVFVSVSGSAESSKSN